MAHINGFFLLEDTHVVLGILFSCVITSTFLSHSDNTFFSSFLSILVSFDNKVMQICGDFMGPRSWESI